MKKFTKVLENQNNEKYFEVSVEVKLLVKAENEGEAGYLSDSIIGGIKEQIDFTISNIEEVSKDSIDKDLNLEG
jgi:hypothetical protein